MFKRIISAVATIATALTLTLTAAVPAQAATPKAPTSLKATAGDEQIVVTWKKTSGVNGYLAQVSPGEQQCAVTASKSTCTITGLTNGVTYKLSLYSVKGASKSKAVTKSGLKTASKTLTISGTLQGDLTTDKNAKCQSWSMAQKSNAKPACALRVVALTAAGQMLTSNVERTSTKSFKITGKVSSSQRSSITLHLMRADGSYVGPVVLKADKNKKLAYTSIKASGNANVTLALGKVSVKSVDGESAYGIAATSPKSTLLNSTKTVALVQQGDATLAPAGAGRAGFVEMPNVTIQRSSVTAAADTDPCASANNTANGEGTLDNTCYQGILGFLASPDGSQAPFTSAQFITACGDEIGKTLNQIIASDPDGCGGYVSKLFAGSLGGGNGGGNGYQQLTKCADFGLIQDGAGFISGACYDEANTQLQANSDSLDNYCPARADLITVAKNDWVANFGQEQSFNCLSVFEQQFGLGNTENGGDDCSQANPGADTDGDGIPNALDVDDNGDLVIDMADPNNHNGCSIEPAKSIRTNVNQPLNYGLVGGDYTVDNLNSDINQVLSGGEFGIAYYAYRNEFFPNAKIVNDTLPAVWITCPGVIWCDPATSRATTQTGVEQRNAKFSVTQALYVAASGQTPARIKYTYEGTVDPVVGDQLQIDGFDTPAFNYSNINVVSVNKTNKTILVNAPASYCVYSNGQNAILQMWESCDSRPVEVTSDSFPASSEVRPPANLAAATFANPRNAPGDSKTWFSFANSAPFNTWSAKTENSNTKSKWQNSPCANDQGMEDAYLAAEAVVNSKQADYEAALEADPSSQATNDAKNAYDNAMGQLQQVSKDRLMRTPCWSELGAPMQFVANTEQDANCQNGMNLNPGYASEIKSQFTLPTEKVNYLWQTKCVGPTFTYSVNAAFISPNVNRLAVNEDQDDSNDISAKDALSATDVLNLNYFQADGSIGSIATTIGSYPITAPLVTAINSQTVDYSKRSESFGIDRTLGTYGNGYTDGNNGDFAPHAAVIGDSGTLSVDFIRPQREAFPGENTDVTDDNARFHDVYGLSYGIEFELGSTLAGCGANFAASKGGGMAIGPSFYESSASFADNISGDQGANYLAPMKDTVTDAADKAPASESLSLTLHVADCFKQRLSGDLLRDLQLPYGAKTDGTAADWMPSGVGNGDTSCVSGSLNARGEAKTGGTDTSGESFCLQFAPGTLVAPNQAGDNVNYLNPDIGWAESSTSNGATTASIHLKNIAAFADSCTFSGTLTPTDGGDQPATVTWTNGALEATGLTDQKSYQVEISASNCIDSMPDKVLSSTAIGDFSFIAGVGSGGNNGGQCNDPAGCNGGQCNDPAGCNGCQQNCGPNYGFGNAYTTQDGFKAYFYGYSPSDGNTWTFTLTKSGGSVGQNVTISQTPQEESQGNGIYYISVGGFDVNGADNGDYLITVTAKDGSQNDLFASGNEPKLSISWPFSGCWGDCAPTLNESSAIRNQADTADAGFKIRIGGWRNDLTYTWSMHKQSDDSVVQATLRTVQGDNGDMYLEATSVPDGTYYIQYIAKDSNGNERFGGAQKSAPVTFPITVP